MQSMGKGNDMDKFLLFVRKKYDENPFLYKSICAAVFITILAVVLLVVFFNRDKSDTISETKETKEINESMETSESDISSASVSETEEETISPVLETVYDDGLEKYDLHISEEQKVSGAVINVSEVKKNEEYALGMDVSKWQGKIDWTKVKESGIEFAMIRLGYRSDDTGEIFEDTFASYNLYNAAKNGIYTGVYFFSTAVNEDEAKKEAEWVVNYIKKYSISYPVVYNCEGFTNSDSRMNKVTNAERTKNAISFLTTVSNAGYKAMLYAGVLELENDKYYNTSDLEKSFDIWIARYPQKTYPEVLKPEYSGKYSMWQYTNMGKVSGIDGYVDLDISYYKVNEAVKPVEEGLTEVIDSVESLIKFTTVDEYVTAKIETNLRNEMSTINSTSLVAVIKNGEKVKRVGIGSNGWSKLIYNNQTVYAVTSLLKPYTEETTKIETTKTETTIPSTTISDTTVSTTSISTETTTMDLISSMKFKDVADSVTAKEETNLRSLPATDNSISKVVYTLKNGEYISRTGISDKGWSRVIYNGEILYAVTSYLKTD